MSRCPACGAEVEPELPRCTSCGALAGGEPAPAEDADLGRELPGGYVLLERIAAGPVGRVYAAEQIAIARTVAVEIIDDEVVRSVDLAAALAEARAATRLVDPGIARLFEVGRTARGRVFLVSELARGGSIADDDRPWPVARAAAAIGRVLRALAAAHEEGISHGSIDVACLLRGADGTHRLGGFGRARFRRAGDPSLGDPSAAGDVRAAAALLVSLTSKAPRPTTASLPDALAKRVLAALDEDPKRRPTAAALADALDGVASPSSAPAPIPPKKPKIACSRCGAVVPDDRFCGVCGARLPVRSLVPAADVRQPLPLPLVARDEDLAWLEDRRREAEHELVGARLVGETGAGKTRLLAELVRRATIEGDRVVATGPDVRCSGVASHALRRAIFTLVPEAARGRWDDAPPDALPALVEIARGVAAAADLRTAIERRQGNAAALRWALVRASAQGKRIFLAIDDLDRCDPTSRKAFADVVGEPPHVAALVVAAHVPGFDAGWPAENPARIVSGIPADEAARLLRPVRPGEKVRAAADAGGRGVLPLYLDQLARFFLEGGGVAPARLGDLVAARVARLAASDRAVLAAVAVLGAGDETTIAAVSSHDDVAGKLADLRAAGFVERHAGSWMATSPLVRDVVLAETPFARRRELHERARRTLDSPTVPLEIRAHHASLAEAPAAVRLLLQLADRAIARGDLSSTLDALRRAFDLAVRLHDDRPDAPTLLRVATRLAAELVASGDFSEAERVVRITSSAAAWAPADKARLVAAEAHVARAKHRESDAEARYDEAIAMATEAGDAALVEELRAARAARPRVTA